ncbi:MAG TPA: hypothetical protein VGE98_01385, partial [Thermoanaerobaculia bacterium]
SRWRAVWVHSPEGAPPRDEAGGLPAMVGLIEQQQLVACLERSVERVAEPPARSRDYLRRLLTFLKSHAAERQAARPDELPSQRQLAQLLEIPRERLPELFRTLRELAETCRRRISGEGSR